MPNARDRVLAQQALAQQALAQQALAQVAGQIPAVFFQFRRGGAQGEHFPFASDRLTELTELTPAALQEGSAPFWALFGPDDTERAVRLLERSADQLTPWELEVQARLPSGRLRWLTLLAIPFREADGGTLWHGILLDATERRRVQQAAKMDAIGRLAGGVAHDLNNLLTAIGGNIDLALIELPAGHAVRDSLERSRQAAERAAELTRQLLAVGQRQVLRLEPVRWNDVVTRAADGGRLPIPDRPELVLELRLDDAAPAVLADRLLLEQVLVYLLANAVEAMPEPGQITIATGHRTIDEPAAGSLPGMRPGDYAWLAVQDTGIGFDGGTQLHLFEPFFTTKVVDGRSGGLGLSTVYGIVKQLGGYIYADSVPGTGTTFMVYLPVASSAAPDPAPERRRPSSPNGLVLVAEDEDGVREPVRRVLERFGYRVIDAPNGRAALAAAAQCREPIDLLLTDIVMPGMSGSDLARQLRQLHPDVRVLFMSGYSSEAVATHGMLAPGSLFLAKPFSVTELMARVREILDRMVL